MRSADPGIVPLGEPDWVVLKAYRCLRGRQQDMIGLERANRELRAPSDKALDSVEAQFSRRGFITRASWECVDTRTRPIITNRSTPSGLTLSLPRLDWLGLISATVELSKHISQIRD